MPAAAAVVPIAKMLGQQAALFYAQNPDVLRNHAGWVRRKTARQQVSDPSRPERFRRTRNAASRVAGFVERHADRAPQVAQAADYLQQRRNARNGPRTAQAPQGRGGAGRRAA